MRRFERVELRLCGGGLRTILVHRGFVCSLFGRGGDGQVAVKNRRRKERLHGEVIPLSERLELVVVAPRTAERQAEENRSSRVRGVIQCVQTPLNLVGRIHHVRPEEIKGGGSQR